MKKKISLLPLFLFTFSLNLFAHDGHVHTGTFWENVSHFILTNGYIVVPIVVAAYFLVKSLKSLSRQKNK